MTARRMPGLDVPGSSFETRRRSRMIKRLTGYTWNFERADLPNQDGFVFLGFMKDGTFEWCWIVQKSCGLYHVHNNRFSELCGWRESQMQHNEFIPAELITNDRSLNLLPPNQPCRCVIEDRHDHIAGTRTEAVRFQK